MHARRARATPVEPLEPRRLFTVVAGFTQSLFVGGGLDAPTAMEFAPDGRLFVAEQTGAVRVVQPDGRLNVTPFANLSTTADGERGLIGLTLDPDFEQNGFVYVYYTVAGSGPAAPHNRVVRLTADGDVARFGVQTTIFDLDPLSGATNHNGGAMHFGPDGKLYVAVGDNANGANAQSLATTHGKMLRLNPDGSIPGDNPFAGQTTGNNRAIWAMGLRNPFTFEIQPGTGRIFINDVGQGESEEINDGAAGANYGWPGIEGPRAGETPPANYRDPVLSYGHDLGIAITGGTFYNPPAGATAAFPAEYTGDYFYADIGGGFVRRFDPSGGGGADVPFATAITRPVDIDVDAAGNLYALTSQGNFNGQVTRFASGAIAPLPPGITQGPQDLTVQAGRPATFSVQANGSGTLRYQWQRDGVDIPGATSLSFTLPSPAAADDGARFGVVVTNNVGSTTSDAATLTVSANQAPSATITAPAAGATFAGGDVIAFAGDAADPEDGALPDGAFSWRVEYVTGEVVRPFLPETPGVRGGSFTAATQTPYLDVNVLYRVTLTVTDSGGARTVVSRDLAPRTGEFALRSEPAGIPLTLDGQPAPAGPVTGVAGLSRVLGAPATATAGGVAYVFDHWSDGGAATHAVSTLDDDGVEYVATYRPVTVGNGAGLAATYFDNADFTGRSVSRIDPAIDFDFGVGSPDPAIAPKTFSARWTAQLEPSFTESYTFDLTADDGARVTVDGVPLIDQLRAKRVNAAAAIDLEAGRRYDLVVEYVQRKGPAFVRLAWSSPSTPQQVVPSANLFPPPGAGATLIRFPSADASTQDGKRANRASGGAKSLLVGTGGKAGSNREAFLTFDLTGLPDPTGATLTLTGRLKGKLDAQLGVFAVDDTSWSESSLTHGTRPATGGSPLAAFDVVRGGRRTYEIDLTNYLLEQKMLGRTSVSIALKSLTAGPVAAFGSREAKAGGPALTVTANG